MHELGHKLINVSHEGFNICPAFEGVDSRSLMLNGEGIEIPKGPVGRWHFERLHLSPFLYRIENGVKRWNRDYMESGAYRDPIYGNYTVTPACPNKP